MPVECAYETAIEYVSILDEHAVFDESLGEGLIPDEDVIALYRHMSMCRHFDHIAFKLQRSGRMGTYPENRGQEATSLGAAYALEDNDWLVTCYRENAGLFWRGVDPEKILLHWMGDERGNNIPQRCTPLAIPIGTQMLHATGLAWASKYRGDGGIACTFFGDGATSEGDFHEAMNFAANLDLPVVFVCQNNSWAISVPAQIQCSAPTIAQRGLAYGMHSVQVDGNDLFAMVKVIRDAANRARTENRPTFIEAVTYRLGDHTTADDASRYQPEAQVKGAWEKEPIARLAYYMESQSLWSPEQESQQRDKINTLINKEVERYLSTPQREPTALFEHLYATLPTAYLDQRDELGENA